MKKIRNFKLKNREKMPVLGMGTFGIGGKISPDKSTDKQWLAALRKGIELGLTHIDTAELYGGGHAEELVGKAILDFKRDDIFITTKVAPENITKDGIINSCNKSLERLGVDYVDLYLVHWPNPDVPLEETADGLEFLIDNNNVRAVGTSNFSPEIFTELQMCMKKHELVANQMKFSLVNQDNEALEFCLKNKLALIAYSPLGQGELTKPGRGMLDKLAEKYRKTRVQVALNWVLQKGACAIPKASSEDHLKENSGAAGWKLDEQDALLLEQSF